MKMARRLEDDAPQTVAPVLRSDEVNKTAEAMRKATVLAYGQRFLDRVDRIARKAQREARRAYP
jgi:RPA family protein